MAPHVRSVPVFTHPNQPGWWIRVHRPNGDPLARIEHVTQQDVDEDTLPPGGLWVWSPIQDKWEEE